jgi:histidine triad (HIT) family protein
MNSEDCLFCKIVRGEVPSSLIFQDDICMAFMDVYPITTGHCLLIPKQHFVNLLDVDGDVLAHMSRKLSELTKAVLKATGAEGVLNVVANGEGAGQEIAHLHFHSIPRSRGDPFGFKFPPGYRETMAPREELDRVSNLIRKSI